ncbi:MAG: GNAT family N-acetyltransferase [Rhizobiaceae bacterium]|jgi:putative hemolysin|nr:GNAT family N-acetyltransferase [Rhizobiaceae bacterium]
MTVHPSVLDVPAAVSLDATHRGGVLGRIGQLEVRLARGESEIEAAQRVRHRVFRAEFGGESATADQDARDADQFDAHCDHVIVLDQSLAGPQEHRIVGTYRLLPHERAVNAGGFYSEQEFTLRGLVARHPEKRFLELGRSCVLPQWRSKRTMELLWQGVWACTIAGRTDVLVGCASFAGTVPAAHAMALSWLHHHHRAKGNWRVKALPERHETMDLMPAEAVDMKRALFAMPALIKGYLRLGAMVGEGCVVDADFGTTDVFVVLPVARISARYIRHYGADAGRFAA